MELLPGTTSHGFQITKRENLAEISGVAIEAIHVVSGARLLFLQNDDNNKAFAIGFRTPPADNTGVFHILEHSVLCGSSRFPVKEPFVDLLKSSMQTFLNAMTFADKTLYPVASTNEQDLFNLMDVYLDAVFHPNIFEKRQIFQQEGWHYELYAADSDSEVDSGEIAALPAEKLILRYNGVVFNEMKGALSDANSVLYNEVQASLFPDTCYAFESGGTPEGIPTLTYENYLNEHRRHYRTDNSYLILYGNLDAKRALSFLSERYLIPVAAEQDERDKVRTEAGCQPLMPRKIEKQNPVDAGFRRYEMVTAPENACAACGYVIGDSRNRTRIAAVDILVDALFGSNETPLKRALLDAGLAHDVHAYVSDALRQPFVCVELQMPANGAAALLRETLANEVCKLIDDGFNRELVEAALAHEEFTMREHDMGIADGVANAIMSLSGWLYDDTAATSYLRYEDMFAELRAKLPNGYFEQLALELFCENNHVASVEVVPVSAEFDSAVAQLEAKNSAFTLTDRRRIVEEQVLLRELQEMPDTPEAVATLPRLLIADIGDSPEEPAYGLDSQAPLPCVRHSVATQGITYVYRYFNLDSLSFSDLPYVSVLSNVLGKLDTAHHSAADLDTLIQGKLGNLSFFSDVFEHCSDISHVLPRFVVGASCLAENINWLVTLSREILLETDFSDTGKILDVLKQRKISMEHAFANSGHSCASSRLKSYYAPAGVIREQLGNVDFYWFLCDLIEHFNERAEALSTRLADVAMLLFCDDNCTVSFAGSDESYRCFWEANPECGHTGDGCTTLIIPEPVVRNEAFVVPSDVSYTATGWDRRLIGAGHSGSWLVAARALSYDYLWNEVRVKGGAYGTGFQAVRSGNLCFYSYRDPYVDETLARFASAASWLQNFSPTSDAYEGYVVSTVATLDSPIKPRVLIRRQMSDFFTGHEPKTRIECRHEVIATEVDDVRALAPVVADAVSQGAVCSFGNRAILEKNSAKLELISLIG